MDLMEVVWGVSSGFNWLRIGTVGGLLWMRWWTFRTWRHGVSSSSVRQRQNLTFGKWKSRGNNRANVPQLLLCLHFLTCSVYFVPHILLYKNI
jgi:hypothetical protein